MVLFITLIALAGANGLLGVYLLQQKKMMLIDALAHSVLPGIVIAYMLTGSKSSFWVVILASMTSTLVMEVLHYIKIKGRVKTDAGIGLVYTFMFALGMLMIAYFLPATDLDQECVLSGDIALLPFQKQLYFAGIQMPIATWGAIALLSFVSLYLLCFKEALKNYSFDPHYSHSLGLKTNVFRWLFHFVLSVVVVGSFDMLGTILVVGMVAIPAASSFLLFKTWKKQFFGMLSMVLISVLIALFWVQYFNLNIGHLLVVIYGALFLIIFIVKVIVKKMKHRWNKKINFAS